MMPTTPRRPRHARAGFTALAVSGLLALTACGSDDDAVRDAVDSVVPEVTLTGDSSPEATTTSEGTSGSDTAVAEYDPSGMTDTQRGVMDMILPFFATAGIEVDAQCFADAVRQLNDADAQKIIDAGPEGDPELGEEGQAIGDQAAACIPDISIPEISIPGFSVPELTAP